MSGHFAKFTDTTPLLLVAALSLSACSSHAPVTPETIHKPTAQAEAILPALVAETSGLVCLADGSFLTINDSGHSATVVRLNSRGEVLAQFAIDATNHDWEAMTIHQDSLLIGDIGNNKGARTGGDLYQTSLQLSRLRLNPAQKTSFEYPDLPLPPLQAYQHDFDAEAIVSANHQLLLFNKAWQNDHSTVYQLKPSFEINTANNVTTVKKIATIDGLPGVITGGAYSHTQQLFVLTGYARFRDNVLNLALYDNYRPFLAVVNAQFQLQKTVEIAQGGQIEAICIDAQQQIWLTQEQSKRRPALLWRWGSLEQLVKGIAAQPAQIN